MPVHSRWKVGAHKTFAMSGATDNYKLRVALDEELFLFRSLSLLCQMDED